MWTAEGAALNARMANIAMLAVIVEAIIARMGHVIQILALTGN